MGKHTKRHVSFESCFSFVEGPLHSKAMFEGGDPRLNARPPCLSAPEPALLLADRALSTQRASSRQNYLLNSQFCSQSLIVRAPVTAISRRQPRGPAKEGNMVLERRCPLLLVGPVARPRRYSRRFAPIAKVRHAVWLDPINSDAAEMLDPAVERLNLVLPSSKLLSKELRAPLLVGGQHFEGGPRSWQMHLTLAVFRAPQLQLLLSLDKRCCFQWNTNRAAPAVRSRNNPHLRIKPFSPPHESPDFSLAAIPHRDEPCRMSLFRVFGLHRVTVAQSVAHGQLGELENVVTCCK